MIEIQRLKMSYPIPKKYVDYILRPFQKQYFTALHGIDLKIEDGHRVAFLGANGAGKTTLLKLIGGLLFPSTGSLVVDGYETVKDNLKARKNVGFVLNEERSFYWRLTGVQNLQFFGTLDNLCGEELQEKIRQLLILVGLEESGHKLFAGYSSGMRQRLAIARGLLSDPKILILDEPTRTLDPISANDIKNIIKERIHTDQARTLLIATHRLDEAAELCNKVCIMNKGLVLHYGDMDKTISQFGTLEQCYRHYITGGKTEKALIREVIQN